MAFYEDNEFFKNPFFKHTFFKGTPKGVSVKPKKAPEKKDIEKPKQRAKDGANSLSNGELG